MSFKLKFGSSPLCNEQRSENHKDAYDHFGFSEFDWRLSGLDQNLQSALIITLKIFCCNFADGKLDIISTPLYLGFKLAL